MSQHDPLGAVEARVLGVLIEKELTTPDHYPLSLNALTNGCNQKSNRDPVTDFGESEVRAALDRLRLRQLAGGVQSVGSRVERFRHNAREAWGVSTAGAAVLAELLLRGAQTTGELRSRAARMTAIPTQGDLSAELDALLAQGYVARLEPLPGTRAARFDQLLALRSQAPPSRSAATGLPVPREAPEEPEEPEGPAGPAVAEDRPAPARPAGDLASRVAALEREVARLRAALERLEA